MNDRVLYKHNLWEGLEANLVCLNHIPGKPTLCEKVYFCIFLNKMCFHTENTHAAVLCLSTCLIKPPYQSIAHPITQSKGPRGTNSQCYPQVQSILSNCSAICVSLVSFCCFHSGVICLQRLSGEKPRLTLLVRWLSCFHMLPFHVRTQQFS